MNKHNVTSEMGAGRIVSHGRIRSLDRDFNPGVPFTIYVRPKNRTTDLDVVVQAKLLEEDTFSELPVVLNDWSPVVMTSLKSNDALLLGYDVYWGAGERAGR